MSQSGELENKFDVGKTITSIAFYNNYLFAIGNHTYYYQIDFHVENL